MSAKKRRAENAKIWKTIVETPGSYNYSTGTYQKPRKIKYKAKKKKFLGLF